MRDGSGHRTLTSSCSDSVTSVCLFLFFRSLQSFYLIKLSLHVKSRGSDDVLEHRGGLDQSNVCSTCSDKVQTVPLSHCGAFKGAVCSVVEEMLKMLIG